MSAEVQGVLILDKPQGITSFDCVAAVRRLYGTKKVGHTGTLDPLATGVLPILVGRAAKAADLLLADEKRYEAILRLGIETDTEDVTGKVLRECAVLPSDEEVIQAALAMRGEQMQTPPMYSALKVNGQKLCDLARKGVEVERAARPITVYDLSCTPLGGGRYALAVRCSKGTYIRTLCADIGKALGCGGAMEALRRTASGPFSIDRATTLEALEAMTREQRDAVLMPTESLFCDLPAVAASPFYEKLLKNGQSVALSKLRCDAVPIPGDAVRLGEGERFFALGRVVTCEGEDAEPFPAVRAEKQFVL